MNLRQRPQVTRGRGVPYAPPPTEAVYNIIPIHDLLTDHPSLRYPEVRAAAAALRTVGDLPKPPFQEWNPNMDLLDWLGTFFGFQNDNVRNQREHIVLHLANSQMRLQPPPPVVDSLAPSVLRSFRRKVLHNYTSWCSYLGIKSSVSLSNRRDPTDLRRELLYVSLYLLIWGESANLRFTPECICYIYHYMGKELNNILDDIIDPDTGRPYLPSVSGDCAFLKCVVMPIYQTIKTEVESSRNGKAPHSAWRNYDDINEYFWSRRCLRRLKWPLDFGSNFLGTTPKNKRVGKTGFVEQRSFWNVFRSFDRLWVMLILFLQAAIIVAWERTDYPWHALEKRDVQVELLTVFITWSGLRLLQSVLDAGTQYSLVSTETKWIGVRMVLKGMFAITWTVVFAVFYGRIWSEKNSDGMWSHEANRRIITFLEVVLFFLIPELLALILFILPWIRNFIEVSDWRIVYLLTWWFHTRIFVGRGVREGLINNIKYTVFWIAVLASKFSFSYFVQIKPLIAPTKALLNLKGVRYNWHEFFSSTNRIAVVLLWVPVVLIYFMDLQIWYSIFSSFVGAVIGLFSHLGEIRNIKQLRLRFQFFSSALQFNLMPEELLLGPTLTLVKKLHDAIHRLKLRYGLGQPYKKMESNQVEATRFALIWNEIMVTFREEDLISDRELELLELPPNCWNIRVIRWPCFLLCNELLLALNQAKEMPDEPDRSLWMKICKSEYGRCTIAAFRSEKFTAAHRMSLLPEIHTKLIEFVELLMQPKKDMNKAVNLLQAMYELSVREFPRVKKSTSQLKQEGLAPLSTTTDEGLLFENAIEFPDAADAIFYKQLRRLHTILTSRDSMHNVPANIEARRRIAFFSNSLFMNMPRAPYVEKMMAFSVLTPYYDEEVLYKKEMLRTENEDGITTLFYLQKIYEDEWRNFMERMYRKGMEDDNDIWTTKARDLRLWASHRGQTLSRTVRGMMYYYRALKMLAFLDSASEMDIRQGTQGIASHGSTKRNGGLDAPHSGEQPSVQNFSGASSFVSLGRDETEYYSVLVKYDQQLQREVEIYRIRLPGPLKLGEGKPENQNHAIIFTRGDALQAIDMNQDNYFEEALKLRNLLEEFKNYYGIRKPTILGVRENIFTGSVSSLAWFMSAQETSFVTLGQRVLANPLKVRMHYGHPDVFDRFWFLTRGGISKASRVINISEDIFAGFNCTLRGGNVTHHEYIQVGKGRDVGLNQISMFEAKVASGNAFLWGRLYLALSGVEKAAMKNASNNKALGAILDQQFIIQLGLFTALPMIVENSLEHGFLPAVWDFLTMQLQLASFFYTFSLGTHTHFFGRTILHGGAKYRATGRGFVVQHKSFAENYRLYARSHFVKAIELGIILIVYAVHSPLAKNTFVYIAMMISSWFLVVSWMMAPFIFNPSGFDWLKTVYDFDDFMNWIWFRGGVFTKAEESWETWWYEEQDHLRTTGLWGKLLEIILDLRFFFFQYGIVYQLGITFGNRSIAVYLLSWVYMIVAVGFCVIIAYARDKYAAKEHIYYRLVQLLVIIVVVLVIVLLLEFTHFTFVDLVTSLIAFIPTGWGMILIAQVLKPFLQATILWETVVSLAQAYDFLFGVIVMAPVALLSWLPGFQSMQTRILFNEAFSRGLQISRILTGKKSA
ncbi:Callose synthase-like protein [Quillaja saponaria]|uniref:1,3-beta-glucan synthase n=1 Tax=Quillaja saponaria TaxID=32244 RepID=A0AAD7M273_QUISA|nr:Callose synthase-like protein [Quillaja saponaria]